MNLEIRQMSQHQTAVLARRETFSRPTSRRSICPRISDQVFNCNESGLYYKLLPNKSLVTAFEKSAAGRKRQNERVTINACSNASGTIKLPLLLIGKSKEPQCFKNICRSNLPVVYDNQCNAWMCEALFKTWFFEHL